MSEFRTGNKAKSHPYPATPRGGGALAFARNSAIAAPVDVSFGAAPTQIPWLSIESGAPAGVNVPITPKVTGTVEIEASITVKNTGLVATNVLATLQIGGVAQPFPFDEEQTVPAAGTDQQYATFPLRATLVLPVGVTSNVEILLTANTGVGVSIFIVSAALNLEEKSAATG